MPRTTTGRWSTVDPKGFEAGDPDLYRFVGNEATIASTKRARCKDRQST